MSDSQLRFVVFHKPGPNWKSGLPFDQQPGVQDHVQYCLGLFEKGRLSEGGPFLDNTGGMMFASQGEDFEEVVRFAKEDPCVKNGLLGFEVKPWLVVVKRGSR